MKKWLFICCLLSWSACREAPQKQSANKDSYFDLAGYFKKEASRLQQLNPTISKEVQLKSTIEKKSIRIRDWQGELASFREADINKSSWRGEFETTQSGSTLIYKTNNPKIPVKRIEILKVRNRIMQILIIKATENFLYTSSDTLIYHPDSLYRIQNNQQIRWLSPKRYLVIGRF